MKISNILIHSCLLSILSVSNNAYSGSVNDKLNALHSRLHKLETLQDESAANVQMHGVVEVEFGLSEDYAGDTSSDITLATVELAIEATVNDNVDIQLSLLYEENDTPLQVDVGIINLHAENSPLSLSLGQMYVPFGAFASNMVSDPLTLELGETRESSILLKYESSGWLTGLYLFNGDIDKAGDEDKVKQFGINLGFESDTFEAGLDYMSAISDTDTIQDYLGGPATVVDQVAGLSVHAKYNMGVSTLIIEYLAALDSFDSSEIVFKGEGARPAAMNLEFAMSVPVAGRDSTIAVAYQSSKEAVALGLPETRMMLVYATEIYESTSLAFEYLLDTDYDLADGGTDETSTCFTLQLATEF